MSCTFTVASAPAVLSLSEVAIKLYHAVNLDRVHILKYTGTSTREHEDSHVLYHDDPLYRPCNNYNTEGTVYYTLVTFVNACMEFYLCMHGFMYILFSGRNKEHTECQCWIK